MERGQGAPTTLPDCGTLAVGRVQGNESMTGAGASVGKWKWAMGGRGRGRGSNTQGQVCGVRKALEYAIIRRSRTSSLLAVRMVDCIWVHGTALHRTSRRSSKAMSGRLLQHTAIPIQGGEVLALLAPGMLVVCAALYGREVLTPHGTAEECRDMLTLCHRPVCRCLPTWIPLATQQCLAGDGQGCNKYVCSWGWGAWGLVDGTRMTHM